ncbi:MAG: transcription-repair coupling factor [Sedimentisphaerales bacterium]|nr:transcription-repair coupling factor [Sedimentisphaerales bacterium]
MSESLRELNQVLPSLRIETWLSEWRPSADRTGGALPAVMELYGSWGSLPRLVAALVGEQVGRPVLYICGHIPDAFEAQDDLETFLDCPLELLPAAEAHETDMEATSEIAGERLRLCKALHKRYLNHEFTIHNSQPTTVIATPIQALMQPVPDMNYLQDQSLTLVKDDDFGGPNALAEWLTDHRYEHVDQVDRIGEFTTRGGIVDIFAPGIDQPIRVEFFGDQIESLRHFDLDTQRSQDDLASIAITGCENITQGGRAGQFLDYLPDNTLIIIEDSTEVHEVGRMFLQRLSDHKGIYPVEAVLRAAAKFDTLYINRFSAGCCQTRVNLKAQSVQRFEGAMAREKDQTQPDEGQEQADKTADSLDELVDLAREQQVYLYCEKPAQRQRLQEMIAERMEKSSSIPAGFHLPIGFVHHGFALPESNLLVLSHHELFGQHHVRRRIRRIQAIAAIDSFVDLDKGDLVVHVSHGIGRFQGLKTLTKHGRQEEFLAIEYADKAVMHVPASKIELVHKYVGSYKDRPRLSKLGSRTWQRQKEKVSEAVEDMAAELIELQAHRQSRPGITYPPDTIWQQEFEQSFPYQDTDDQITVNRDIKQDMQQPRPMDRLLCGDVGYGKTELSVRAAFKAVEAGKQVAVLVPTTVLAQQHYRTFTDRLADFPFIVESLSRFKTTRQAKDIIKRTMHGQVDILIGTHRLLSDDVHFKDLGLVIIDEEQRFGVVHKERLKQMRRTVDILTMTATPIPRTLHMALLGIRDISSLSTPPLDRRSIVTEVCAFDNQRIRNIILRELAREGQVYFLHNRVHNIMSVADTLKRLVPEARIIVAHGQMPKRQLESRMLDFVNFKADVLVCTTIIESGLDIPNANTIIINDADRFGLAELHQLRGRVGRYKNRAYAYMLLPTRRSINPVATKRLKAIEEYSQLGSGFRIALRDLEIRGAGNILGVEQSGHIDAVGYELYCRLLAAAVQRRREEPVPTPVFTHLELNISSNIPRNYIPADRQRMEVYRRLATCQNSQDLDQLEKDLNDLFGRPPRSVKDLLHLAEIRILASQWSIRSIVQQEPDLIFNLHESTQAGPLFTNTPGSVRIPDQHTVHLRLDKRYFESNTTLIATLRKVLKK